MSEIIDERLALIEPFEERIGIPRGTMKPLLNDESDWGFIIKLGVILEASLTEAIISHLDNESLREHVRGLQQQGRVGRIPFAIQVGAITEGAGATLGVIASVRNQFAHSPRHIGGSLVAYAKGLDLHEKQQIFKRLFDVDDAAAKDAFDPKKGKSDWLPEAMRFVLWLAAQEVLTQMSISDARAEMLREMKAGHAMEALARQKAEVLKMLQGKPELVETFREFQAMAPETAARMGIVVPPGL
jgi:hypothetical protein